MSLFLNTIFRQDSNYFYMHFFDCFVIYNYFVNNQFFRITSSQSDCLDFFYIVSTQLSIYCFFVASQVDMELRPKDVLFFFIIIYFINSSFLFAHLYFDRELYYYYLEVFAIHQQISYTFLIILLYIIRKMLPTIIGKQNSSKNTNPLKQQEQNGTLITGIIEQEVSSKHKLSGKKFQVYVIEDSMPPTTFAAHQKYTNLPSTVQFSRIVANVITSLSTSYFKQIETKKGNQSEGIIEKWTKYLNYEENKALVSDCFWFAICKFFRPAQFPNSEKQLEKRIADNYIGLFLSIEDKHQKQLFFKQYFNVLAQSVFYSFFYAYPKSRSKFNNKLKDELLSMFSQLFTGVQISNTKNYYQKWTLDLGTGNILAKKSKNSPNQDELAKTMESNKKAKISFNSSVFERTKKRQTLPIRYSPIVELYLKNHKYKTRNYVSQFKMKYSQVDKNDKQKQAKFADYRNQATRILEWSQNQKVEQDKKRQQLESQIKAIKRQTINHHKRLDRRKAEELERGAHQYANYLVSMLNAGITMTSLGVIRKNVS